jgi:hypothetical protein
MTTLDSLEVMESIDLACQRIIGRCYLSALPSDTSHLYGIRKSDGEYDFEFIVTLDRDPEIAVRETGLPIPLPKKILYELEGKEYTVQLKYEIRGTW